MKLIKLAALASSTIYHKPNDYAKMKDETNKANIFNSTRYIPASNSGNIKAVSLSHVVMDSTYKQSTLFIAIHGSASLMDWLVNANGDVVDVDETFLVRVLLFARLVLFTNIFYQTSLVQQMRQNLIVHIMASCTLRCKWGRPLKNK